MIVSAGVALLLVACGEGATVAEPATAEDGELTSSDGISATSIRPGRANWPTGYFQAAVYSALLEELGFEVDDPANNEYPPADAYTAMAEGVFDFWANGWYSQHDTWHEQELADGSLVGDHLVVLGDQVPASALEGLVITRSLVDEHGIRSLDHINSDPELVALFDSDGDGLGEVHGCPEAWTCDDIIDEMIAFNGWSNLEQIKAEYPGLVGETIQRVQAGEPAIQYIWSPSGYLGDLSPGKTVYWLSVGENGHVLDGTTAGGFDFSSAPAAPFVGLCTDDPCWIGWEVSDIKATANSAFVDANPTAATLLELIELPIEDIVAQNVRYEAGENTEADVRRHAAEWIDANRLRVDGWLATAGNAT